MTIEICLCVIAACIFIFTITFLIMSRNARKTMRQIDSALFEIKDNLNLLTDETLLTLSNANRLLGDWNFKSEALNVFFRPLSARQTQAYFTPDKIENLMTQSAELINLLLRSIDLFKQLRRK